MPGIEIRHAEARDLNGLAASRHRVSWLVMDLGARQGSPDRRVARAVRQAEAMRAVGEDVRCVRHLPCWQRSGQAVA